MKKRQRPRVRTGHEVLTHFKDQIEAFRARADADTRTVRERLADARSRTTVHDDGSRSVALTPMLRELIALQLAMFEFKFGRKPGPNDPLFFDVFATDQPRPMSIDEDAPEAAFFAAREQLLDDEEE